MHNLHNKINLSNLHAVVYTKLFCMTNNENRGSVEKLSYLCTNNVRFKVPIFYNFLKEEPMLFKLNMWLYNLSMVFNKT